MERYSREEILNIVEEEDVEFIRLPFTDMFGTMKNIAIPAGKLPKAMDDRCIIDASSIEALSARKKQKCIFARICPHSVFCPGDLSRERLHG